ncbi:MAG: ribosome maturation factor RimM [Caldilinea sp.]|nr:ribosome maturation factor RimM [Caldilinea sp.]MDW8441270.1 ribosome maturation factor RimM [Caldilineaceae bacterium]
MSDSIRSTPPKRSPRRHGQTYRVYNQEVFVPDGFLAVGHIVGVHGLRGEVKLESYTDFPERFAPGERLRLGDDLVEVEIASVRPHKKFLLIRFEGVVDRTAAEQLRGLWLFVAEEEAAELEEGAYWIHDLIGLEVREESGERLGELVDVLVTGANDVYVVHGEQGAAREILLPAIPEVVLNVDLAAGVMTVRLPEGLLDAEAVD